jgi:hypothetical protein
VAVDRPESRDVVHVAVGLADQHGLGHGQPRAQAVERPGVAGGERRCLRG